MCDGHHYAKTNTRDNRGRDCKVVGLLMVFNATFNNISAISWRSVLFVEETGVS
jgi:hypothetical protein